MPACCWGNIQSRIPALDMALCVPGNTTSSTRRAHKASWPLQLETMADGGSAGGRRQTIQTAASTATSAIASAPRKSERVAPRADDASTDSSAQRKSSRDPRNPTTRPTTTTATRETAEGDRTAIAPKPSSTSPWATRPRREAGGVAIRRAAARSQGTGSKNSMSDVPAAANSTPRPT
jgi:hypothetical protein